MKRTTHLEMSVERHFVQTEKIKTKRLKTIKSSQNQTNQDEASVKNLTLFSAFSATFHTFNIPFVRKTRASFEFELN